LSEAEVHLLLGQAYVNEKQYKVAATEFQKAATLSPNDEEARSWLVTYLAKAGDCKTALQMARADIVKSDSSETEWRLGSVLFDACDFKGAEAAFRAAHDLRSGFADYLYWDIGTCVMKEGQYAAGAKLMMDALSSTPDWPEDNLYLLPQAYYLAHDYANATYAAEYVLDEVPTDQKTWVILGQASAKLGDTVTATRAWQYAVHHFNNHDAATLLKKIRSH
jgi:Flp pilus assembly protein TadD